MSRNHPGRAAFRLFDARSGCVGPRRPETGARPTQKSARCVPAAVAAVCPRKLIGNGIRPQRRLIADGAQRQDRRLRRASEQSLVERFRPGPWPVAGLRALVAVIGEDVVAPIFGTHGIDRLWCGHPRDLRGCGWRAAVGQVGSSVSSATATPRGRTTARLAEPRLEPCVTCWTSFSPCGGPATRQAWRPWCGP